MAERRTALSFTLLRENSLTDSVCTSGETQRNDETEQPIKQLLIELNPHQNHLLLPPVGGRIP